MVACSWSVNLLRASKFEPFGVATPKNQGALSMNSQLHDHANTTCFTVGSHSSAGPKRPALEATKAKLRTTTYALLATLGIGASACAVTSPYWGYVPESTSATIPVQAWTPYTSEPVVVECAKATNAHGGPSPDESAYIVAATIPVNGTANLDSEGGAMYTAAANVSIPSDCWDYFGSYDFWQLNLRITQVQPNPIGGGTIKKVFSSFDLNGLSCLGSANGSAGSWYGFLNQGCEKTYLGESEQIPYIVLRINGYSNGLSASAITATSAKSAKISKPLAPDQKTTDKILAIEAVTPEQIEAFRKQRLDKK